MGECKRVLIVSSDPDLLQTLSWALHIAGFPVSTATGWAQAMAACSPVSPAMIIRDVRGMDAWVEEQLMGLRKVHPEVPVLLLSSLNSPELSQAKQEGLIAASIIKPVHLESLEECVERLGARRQTQEPAGLSG